MYIEDIFQSRTPQVITSGGGTRPTCYSKLYRLNIGNLAIWFSFRTPIAIQHRSLAHSVMKKTSFFSVSEEIITHRYVADNFWGKHTAFHLNYLDGKHTDSRVSREFIRDKINELLPIELKRTRFIFDEHTNFETPGLDDALVGALIS